MITKHENGNISIKGASYDLLVRGHIIDVIICGTAFASLDVRTAINQTNDDLSVEKDAESDIPSIVSVNSKQGEAEIIWTNKSSLWEKEYKLICTYTRFKFFVKIKGNGRVDSVNYFSGNMAAKNFGSGYEFSNGFYPNKAYNDSEPEYSFRAGKPCHRLIRTNGLMVPPMFVYSFRCEGIGERLALGLVAERGEHNFHNFVYNLSELFDVHTGFYLSTDQDGHTYVDGEWTAPYIIGYSAIDDLNACQKYSDYYFSSGIAKPIKVGSKPRFWYGPFICGWLHQGIYADKQGASYASLCKKWLYDEMLDICEKNDLHPKAMVIDDKWMKAYSTYEVDPDRFPNFREYVDECKAKGVHPMLWFMMWSAQGWPHEEMIITDDYNDKALDPSHPLVIENIKKSIRRMLSSEEGCYDCDGLKMDYAFVNPMGKNFKTYSGKYGVELMYDYMELVYNTAHEIKPYALINNSVCHPYFAHICDQSRLHDYFNTNRRNLEDLSLRSQLFAIAVPGALQDTDNAGFITRRDTMRWQLNQQTVGVPDLYALIPSATFDFNSDDLGAIAQVWNEYSAKIDAMVGEDDLCK